MNKKHWFIYLLSMVSAFALLLAGCGNKEENNPNYDSENYLSGLHYAVIEVADYGSIYLELDADVAPATVTNFVNLVNDKFYDGLTFHRIIEGFMMQGGDPKGDGTGSSKYTVPGEFVLNKHPNSISHVRGTISMARTASDYNSASSQFFIVQEDNTDLDGYYAAFGRVISGMDIVDAICIVTDVEDDNGTVLKENQPVIESITMINEEDAIYDADTERPVEKEERPAATAVLTLTLVSPSSVEDLTFSDTWEVHEDGKTFLLSSSTDLLTLGLYTADIANGLEYGNDNLLAITNDLAANDTILVKFTVPDDTLPSLLLVAEEHNGAIARYLVYYNEIDNGAYLVPIFE